MKEGFDAHSRHERAGIGGTSEPAEGGSRFTTTIMMAEKDDGNDRLSVSSSTTGDGDSESGRGGGGGGGIGGAAVSVEPHFFVDLAGEDEADLFKAPIAASPRLTYTAWDMSR